MDDTPQDLHSILSTHSEQVALAIARAKDQCVKAAIRRYTGEEHVDLRAIAPRCQRVTRKGVEGETLYIDGVPILWISDLRFRVKDGVTYTSFDHKMLPEQSDVHPIER